MMIETVYEWLAEPDGITPTDADVDADACPLCGGYLVHFWEGDFRGVLCRELGCRYVISRRIVERAI